MRALPPDPDHVVGCLSYFGSDGDGLLELVFSAAGTHTDSESGKDQTLNLERFSALSLLGKAGILAMIVGPSSAIEAARVRLEKLARGRGDYCALEIIDHPEHQVGSDYSPFPWRLQVLAPDAPGVLTSLCDFLYGRGIKVTGCRGELYEPRQSPVASKSACDLRLTLLLPKTINRSDLELAIDIRSKRHGWLEWSMEPLK